MPLFIHILIIHTMETTRAKKETPTKLSKLQAILQKSKGSDLLGERGERLFRALANSHKTFIANLENKLFQLQDKKEEILDFGRTNSTSLTFKSISDHEKFIQDWHALDVEIALLEEEIRVAKEREEIWF